jgi:nitrogen fixation protein NifB
VHLPVAPKCNIQCNFCNRDYDCANESRPGVTSVILSPGQALAYLDRIVAETPNIAVVGIAGPGDPFANAEETMETMRLVRAKYPDMLLCLASNGLNVAPYVDEIAEHNVSHVTITINAVDPEIAGKIYGWVRDGYRVYRGRDAGALMIERQLEAIKALKARGVTVKINTILIPGINDDHVVEVARTCGELGADIFNGMPLYPVEGSVFESIEQPSSEQVREIREKTAEFMPQMHHCTRCRADAVGLLGASTSTTQLEVLRESASLPLDPEQSRPYVAVASREGLLVNEHLGEAEKLWIFEKDGDEYNFVETRSTPPSGGGSHRWMTLGRKLNDCRAILVSGAGQIPTRILGEVGVRVLVVEGMIEETLEGVYNGLPIRAPVRQHKCGEACTGNGLGCA